jgi:MinD-like ATPase involved in chromosome partitioning or flagellar assembly
MGLSIWTAKLKTKSWTLLLDGDMHIRTIELKMCPPSEVTLVDVLEGSQPIERAVCACGLEVENKPLFPRLAILPAGGRFLPPIRGSPLRFVAQMRSRMQRILEKLRRKFSFIYIDTPASFSFEHLVLTAIADAVVYVAEPNDDSVNSTAVTISGLREFMDVEPLGVVLNRVPRNVDSGEWTRKLERVVRVFGVIPEDEFVGEAFRQNLPVTACYPDSPASRAMQRIARQVLKAKLEKARFESRLERVLQTTMEELRRA